MPPKNTTSTRTRRAKVAASKQQFLGAPPTPRPSRRSTRVIRESVQDGQTSAVEQQAKIDSLSSAVTALQKQNTTFKNKLDDIIGLLQLGQQPSTSETIQQAATPIAPKTVIGTSTQPPPEQLPSATYAQGISAPPEHLTSEQEGESDTDSEGECVITVERHQLPPKLSGTLSIGSTVPFKIKKKIWAHKFIDFSELLDPLANKDEYSLAFSKVGSSPALSLRHLVPNTFQKQNGAWHGVFIWRYIYKSIPVS